MIEWKATGKLFKWPCFHTVMNLAVGSPVTWDFRQNTSFCMRIESCIFSKEMVWPHYHFGYFGILMKYKLPTMLRAHVRIDRQNRYSTLCLLENTFQESSKKNLCRYCIFVRLVKWSIIQVFQVHTNVSSEASWAFTFRSSVLSKICHFYHCLDFICRLLISNSPF